MNYARLLFCFCALACASAFALDSDTDGFSDEFERGVGSDPNNSADTPGAALGPADPLTLSNVGISLNFASTGQDKITVRGTLQPIESLAALSGKKVLINISGVIRVFTLDSKGVSNDPAGFSVDAKSVSAPTFALDLPNGSFAQAYTDEALISETVTAAQRTVVVELVFDGNFYANSFSDTYTAQQGVSGLFGTLATSSTGGETSKSKAEISEFIVTPNPGVAGTAVAFTGAATLSGGLSFGTLDFGDGSSEQLSGSSIKTSLKDAVQHSYATDGVFTATLSLGVDGGASATTQIFVIIGKGTQVNPIDKMASNAKVSDTGVATLKLNISQVSGATTATTTFDDSLGREGEVEGLIPTRAFSQPGISIARSVAKNAAGVERGKVRKTIAVSSRQTGDSARVEPSSSEIKVKKLGGKFVFPKTKADKVDFSGEIELPTDFNPAKAGGNKMTVAIGNVVDSIIIDEKGRATAANGRITKAKISFPKAPKTTAKLSITMSFTNMVDAGFDTEGIVSALRADETKLKAASRSIQIGIVFDGVAYETLAPVSFKVSKNADSGQITGRNR